MYHRMLTEATGYSDELDLYEIEECMRHIIFNSTLDWQTREQFTQGAMDAVDVLVADGVLSKNRKAHGRAA